MARELKYSTPHTDFEALQRELAGNSSDRGGDEQREEEDDEYDRYRR